MCLGMDAYLSIATNLGVALLAGSLIGWERTFHGRPAGFRTHSLVCLTSSMLMLVTLHQDAWLPLALNDATRTDPTRMAQGIMTGIGFLGAGVIYKEGATVHGLTTAASIWMTSAIGILFGVGFYLPGALGTVGALGILAGFRWLEARMPAMVYAYHHVRFRRSDLMPEPDVRALLAQHGFTISNMEYRVLDDGKLFEYRMVIRSNDGSNTARLADTLRQLDIVREFRIAPTKD